MPKVVRVEFNRNALIGVIFASLCATIVGALALGQADTVKPLIALLGKMIDTVKPNIDLIIGTGAVGTVAGYGIRKVVSNSVSKSE